MAALFQARVIFKEPWYKKATWWDFGFSVTRRFIVCLVFYLFYGWRGRVILSIYAFGRYVDDIVDGEIFIDEDIPSYVEHRRDILCKSVCHIDAPTNPEDLLIVHILRESGRKEVSIHGTLMEYWHLFQAEYVRRSTGEIISEKQIQDIAIRWDAVTVQFVLLLLGRTVNDPALFRGFFSRVNWASGCVDDIQQGLVHIPREAINQHHIDIDCLLICKTWNELFKVPGFREWYTEELSALQILEQEIKELIPHFERIFPNKFLRWVFRQVVKHWMDLFSDSITR